MADNLSPQDIQDLQQIASSLKPGDPRLPKVNLLLNSQPTQFEAQRTGQKVGFVRAAGNDLLQMAKSTPDMVEGIAKVAVDPTSAVQSGIQQGEQIATNDELRKSEGRSLPYRVVAGTGEGLGVNARGMEEAADRGDSNAILGHAAASATPYVAGAAIGTFGPKVGKVIENKLADSAPSWYRSALKPTTVPIKQPSVRAAIRTGLDEGIPVSGAGAEKLATKIDEINNRIGSIIEDKGQGVEINPRKVAQRTKSTASAFEQQVNPESDVAAINAAKQEYLDKHTQRRPFTKIELNPEGTEFVPTGKGQEKVVQNYPISEAQREKVGTYTQLRKKYGQLSGASDEAQKALARGIKEEIADAFPEINTLNAKESKLINLDPYIERAVARISNHQKIGIGTPIAAGGVKAVTGSTGMSAVAGAVKAVLDDPNLKSRIAIAMNRASKGRISPALARARIAAYSPVIGQVASTANNQPLADRNTQ